MDKRIKILIEKRKKLGWTIRQLAEKADLSYGEALHVEKKGIYCETYISNLTKAVDKGLKSINLPKNIALAKLLDQASKNRKDSDRISSLGKKTKRSPISKIQKTLHSKEKKWSREHEECLICGTTEIKHAGRGLCNKCYNRDIEEKTKSHKRERGLAGTKLTKNYLIEEYLGKGKSLNDIAKECGCTRQYVHKRMKEFNIPTRNLTQARAEALGRGKLQRELTNSDGYKHTISLKKVDVDEDFFSLWSNEMAYVLGIIYSDGNLSEGYLSISQKKPEILYKVKSMMKCNAELRFQKRKKYKTGISGDLYILKFYKNKIYSDRLKLGLTPDKSQTVNFPDIPQEYVRHFVRGCWDGDGSVYIEKRSGKIKASFTSGSLLFIEGLINELEKAGLKKERFTH